MHNPSRVLKTNAMFRGVLRARATKGSASMRRVLAQATISLLCVTALLAPVRSEAITIDVVDARPDFNFARVFGRPDSFGPFSYERLLSIGNAAADYWESRLVGDQSFRIPLGFLNFGSQVLGAASIGGFAIGLSNNRSHSWFVDPTPFDNSEYGRLELAFADLGGGLLNTGFNYLDPMGDATTGLDAFTVLLHEIGHILSLSAFGGNNYGRNTALIDDRLPFAGSLVALMDEGAHIRLGAPLMGGFGASLGSFGRTLPSDLDILFVADSQGSFGVNLNGFTSVPEPATTLLFLAGLAMILFIGARRPVRRDLPFDLRNAQNSTTS
ncbi:MAG: PEP-CTERM sorting domain-containing protein [Pseudomonadota bacterium]